MYIGIDFGTCYSTLSIYVDNDDYTGLLPALCGKTGVPTLMRYDPNTGDWYYGARCDLIHNPLDTVKNIKAKIRKGVSLDHMITTGGRSISYRELLKNFLSNLIVSCIHDAIDRGDIDNDEQVEGVVVTVPCGFTGSGMTRSEYGQVLTEGVVEAYEDVIRSGVRGARIGNPTVHIVEEPVAAAIEYLTSRDGRNALMQKDEMNVLVADLGGGTFDVTVMKCQGRNQFTVLAKAGDLSLGGNDWDEELLKFLISKIHANNTSFSLSDNDRISDLAAATATKECLSEVERFTFNSITKKSTVVTREEFEQATRDLLKRVKDVIANCVEKVGGISHIDKMILVGGSCRMPQIRNGIHALYPSFNDQNIVLFKPSYSIANGAAHCAAMREKVGVQYLNDIATCTYGFNYRDTATDILYIRNMIFTGNLYEDGKIVRDVSTTYIPLRDDQEHVTFWAYESTYGESEEFVPYEANKSKFNKRNLDVTVTVPPEYWKNKRSEEYEMQPRMTLTSDGILKLEILHNGEVVKRGEINVSGK